MVNIDFFGEKVEAANESVHFELDLLSIAFLDLLFHEHVVPNRTVTAFTGKLAAVHRRQLLLHMVSLELLHEFGCRQSPGLSVHALTIHSNAECS